MDEYRKMIESREAKKAQKFYEEAEKYFRMGKTLITLSAVFFVTTVSIIFNNYYI